MAKFLACHHCTFLKKDLHWLSSRLGLDFSPLQRIFHYLWSAQFLHYFIKSCPATKLFLTFKRMSPSNTISLNYPSTYLYVSRLLSYFMYASGENSGFPLAIKWLRGRAHLYQRYHNALKIQ